jgi:predicted component of type VI protein secretion system
MKPTSSQSDLTLLVEQPGGFTQQVFIQNNLTLGRGDSNIVCIDDPSVDHIHARVLRQADGKFVLQAESQGKINITGPDGGLNEVDKVILEPGLAFKIGTATLTCRK